MSDDSIGVRAYAASDASMWDEFVSSSRNGTFLHSRRFLSYHGDRFKDLSLIVFDSRERVVGLIPAAVGKDPDVVDSHPGITYGGLVQSGVLVGERAVLALSAATAHYRNLGFRSLLYRAIPGPYQRVLTDDDSYALFRLNASRTRVDLAAGFEIATRLSLSHGRSYDLKEAVKNRVNVEVRSNAWPEFWGILEEVLDAKFASRPVHSLAEMALIKELFPNQVELVLARVGEQAVAGAVLFHTSRVCHAQYLASSSVGRSVGALSAVMETVVQRAQEEGRAWVSLGTSNEDGGRVLNSGLYQWKLSLGSCGFVHQVFELAL